MCWLVMWCGGAEHPERRERGEAAGLPKCWPMAQRGGLWGSQVGRLYEWKASVPLGLTLCSLLSPESFSG